MSICKCTLSQYCTFSISVIGCTLVSNGILFYCLSLAIEVLILTDKQRVYVLMYYVTSNLQRKISWFIDHFTLFFFSPKQLKFHENNQ